MAFWNRKKKEVRSVENPNVPISAKEVFELFGLDGVAGVSVNEETALGVPAVWAGVNFIAGTIAGLPLHTYRKTENGREKVQGGLYTILHDATSDSMSSFEWRKYLFERVLIGGRGLSYIERNAMGRVINIYPLDPEKVTITLQAGRRVYEYKEGNRRVIYQANEILDIPFMLKADLVTAINPIKKNEDAIALAIAATKYGTKFFNNGGVPPFAIVGNFQTAAGMKRAGEDLESAVRKANSENRTALAIPKDHELKAIGIDPEKTQLLELKRFSIEEIARIFSLPPTFLQDLTHGTFSNTEQQDLHFVKHTLKRWIEQFEQELNLKLFGRSNSSQYVEFDVDGILRGDFSTRMQGYATGIQNAILKPNEVRQAENRPDDPNGDELLVQGATVPLGTQPNIEEVPNEDGNQSGEKPGES